MEKLNPNTNKLQVLILAAGFGRRMGVFSRMINKALVPYNNRALISHIFDNFDIYSTKFIIACGHNGNQIKDYVKLVHPDKDIEFIDVPDYEEENTGPATTLRYCASQFNGPFMWVSCDTLFKFNYHDKLTHNWIAVSEIEAADASDYSWIDRYNNDLIKFHNKETSAESVDAFIGLMYVHDRSYIDNLNVLDSKEIYEGFSFLNDTQVYTVREWKDFGTYDKWKVHNSEFVDVSFPKPNEIFYDDNYTIVKFSNDSVLTKKKMERAVQNINALPSRVRVSGNFLAYEKEGGVTLYNALTPDRMYGFLDWATQTLWKPCEKLSFETAYAFYHDKTFERLNLFRTKYPTWDEPSVINGVAVKSIDEYLLRVDFNRLSLDVRSGFIHGDMQPENIIYNYIDKRFVAIDWRPDFGGQVSSGDIYYDLAKLIGGLYLDYERVKSEEFTYSENKSSVELYLPSVSNLKEYIEIVKTFCQRKGFDWNKINILVALIYLNMSPLHEAPFDKYLIALSQYFFKMVF